MQSVSIDEMVADRRWNTRQSEFGSTTGSPSKVSKNDAWCRNVFGASNLPPGLSTAKPAGKALCHSSANFIFLQFHFISVNINIGAAAGGGGSASQRGECMSNINNVYLHAAKYVCIHRRNKTKKKIKIRKDENIKKKLRMKRIIIKKTRMEEKHDRGQKLFLHAEMGWWKNTEHKCTVRNCLTTGGALLNRWQDTFLHRHVQFECISSDAHPYFPYFPYSYSSNLLPVKFQICMQCITYEAGVSISFIFFPICDISKFE